jgi:hypothetical protein
VSSSGQGPAKIQAWLFDGVTQVDTKSVSGFFVRNAPPPPLAYPGGPAETAQAVPDTTTATDKPSSDSASL